ncbi:hypothetical protein N2152v2_004323 [Parachlorella kessleri]
MFGVKLSSRLQASFSRFHRTVLQRSAAAGRVLQEVSAIQLDRSNSSSGSSSSSNGGSLAAAQAWAALPFRAKSTVSFPPPPPLPTEEQPLWTDEIWASPLDIRRRVFCNRSLNMKPIMAVGFDMDYTLAQYKPEEFETLAHRQTVEKLVKHFGYPKMLYDLEFDWRYMTRGLVIDKKRGNMIKVDRHKYVKLAYHGFEPLSREDRMRTYNDSGSESNLSFDEPDFALIDTLFSLAEAHLFMQLVEIKDGQLAELPPGKSYADLYRDVRGAVDLCHRDGTIKREVAAHPEKYIHEDPMLVPLLDMLRQAGKKVFLATNSLWDYTHVVMNWILTGKKGNEKDEEWLEYFDAVVTACGKPRYFSERSQLFEVHTATGMLYNTEGGSPMIPIGEEDLPSPILGSSAPSDLATGSNAEGGGKARVFQGGYYLDLHKMLGVKSGSQVLYVGDHIYGDVLRSKKALGWRTMLVIPELETELDGLERCKGNMEELKVLRQQRDASDDQIQRLEWGLSHRPLLESGATDSSDDPAAFAELLANLKEQRDKLRTRHRALLKEHHETFHKVWGQLMKTGYQNSRYAHQIERFACTYTSHCTNLLYYSPHKSWKGRLDVLAHEEDSYFGTNSGSSSNGSSHM